jgi:DnaJ-class molecular chaperone
MALSQKYSYYEILEISPSAAAHEVTAAYKRAKETYSGLDPAIYTIFSEQEARELLKMIEEAYAVLGHRQLRIRYDKKVAERRYKDESELSHSSLLKENSEDLSSANSHLAPGFKAQPELEKKFRDRTDWDGAGLKEVREYKQLSLKDLNAITKVNAFYINSIECMNPSELPAEVFVRGYVHQISRALGLNDKLVVETYMKKYRSLASPTAQK